MCRISGSLWKDTTGRCFELFKSLISLECCIFAPVSMRNVAFLPFTCVVFLSNLMHIDCLFLHIFATDFCLCNNCMLTRRQDTFFFHATVHILCTSQYANHSCSHVSYFFGSIYCQFLSLVAFNLGFERVCLCLNFTENTSFPSSSSIEIVKVHTNNFNGFISCQRLDLI